MKFISSLVICLLIFAAQTHAQHRDPFKIGFIIPQTGPLAEFGTAIKNGVELAYEDNYVLKKVMQVSYEDSKYASKEAVASLKKLKEIDKVNAVYVFGGPISAALAPLAEKSRMPMFSTAYNPELTRNREFVIRFANNVEHYAGILISELRDYGYKKYGIVKVENQYHNALVAEFKKLLLPDETVEIIADYNPDERDFKTAIAKLKKNRFDALGVYLTTGMQNAFLKELKKAQFEGQLFGTDAFESKEENQGVEEIVEGALYANNYVSKTFTERYQEKFNNTTQITQAALAYEFAMLVAKLLEWESGEMGPEQFLSHFTIQRKNHDGVCGRYVFRSSRASGQYFSFPLATRQIVKGKPKVVRVEDAP